MIHTQLEHLIFWLGTMRSGHHAVMNWALSGLPGPVAHRDNITRPLLPDYPQLQRRSRLPSHPVIEDMSTARTISLCFERAKLPAVKRRIDLETEAIHVAGSRAKISKFLVIRDPWNQFASHLEMVKRRPDRTVVKRPAAIVNLWVRYFRFAKKHDFTVIDFNQWAGSAMHREKFAADHGLHVDESTVKQVPGHGGGSSFTGQEKKPRWEELNSRWMKWQHDPTWQEMVNDPRVRDLAEKIWSNPLHKEPTIQF